jgi:hypothetical protein
MRECGDWQRCPTFSRFLRTSIQRSAWKENSLKFASRILHRPTPIALEGPLSASRPPQARHNISWCRIKMRNGAYEGGRYRARENQTTSRISSNQVPLPTRGLWRGVTRLYPDPCATKRFVDHGDAAKHSTNRRGTINVLSSTRRAPCGRRGSPARSDSASGSLPWLLPSRRPSASSSGRPPPHRR